MDQDLLATIITVGIVALIALICFINRFARRGEEIRELRDALRRERAESERLGEQARDNEYRLGEFRKNHKRFKELVELESEHEHFTSLAEIVREHVAMQDDLIDGRDDVDWVISKVDSIKGPASRLERQAIRDLASYVRDIEYARMREIAKLDKEMKQYEHLTSNITAIPYMAEIIADWKTYGLEALARQLDWGYSMARADKVASIRQIRADAKKAVQENLEAKYKLAYLLKLFPALEEVMSKDYRELVGNKSKPRENEIGEYNLESIVEQRRIEFQQIRKQLDGMWHSIAELKGSELKNDDTVGMLEAYYKKAVAGFKTETNLTLLNTPDDPLIDYRRLEERFVRHFNASVSEMQALYENRAKELNDQYKQELDRIRHKYEEMEHLRSNITAIPYMSAIIADWKTYGLEALARQLDWGYSTERTRKVASIREIRASAKEMVGENLEAKYQLQYLLELFPSLRDVIDTDYNLLPALTVEDIAERDTVRDWLSGEEYSALSNTERNQLALDRYLASHTKTKWQIGRDYELYVGYLYTQKGYEVNYFGSYMGLEDLGRDLICARDGKVLIIQCKYWSLDKKIHEKHITQLYGTTASYIVENGLSAENVSALLITNTELSEKARRMAEYLGIEYTEHLERGNYPCIKCNIGRDEQGNKVKIYHLPFDQQYDSTKITPPDEFFALTVEEAERLGFRRAFKYFVN